MNKMNKEILNAYRERFNALESEIDAGIEKHRKSDVRIRVTDREGYAIPGAHISVHQTQSAFNFGCNGLQIGQKGPLNDEYDTKLANLFNLVTTTSCWSITETSQGRFRFTEEDGDVFRRPPLERILAFGRKYGMKVKGQPLMADSWWPDWASREAEPLKKQWLSFLQVMSEQYGDRVDVWDVVNESMCCKHRHPDFPLLTEDLTFVDWCFEQIAEVFPKNHGVFELNEATFVNEGEQAGFYYQMAKRIRDKGLPIEQIGFQFHMFTGEEGLAHLRDEYLSPAIVKETYHHFEQLNLPLAITEVTVPSRMEGFTIDEGECVQAEVARNLYRLWFSMPSINTITYWNLMDGLHWRNEGDCRGCLLDVNMKEKPVYHALYQLIQRKWRTHLDAEINERGEAAFRGFHGDYDIMVECEKGRRSLKTKVACADTNEIVVVL